MFSSTAKKMKTTPKQPQQQTIDHRSRSESANNGMQRSSSHKKFKGCHYLNHKLKLAPSEFTSVYGSIQSTMVSNRENMSKQLDHSKMGQQIQAFDDEKLQLINLYKLQIQQFQKKYEHKCEELQKIDADFNGRKNYVNSQIQELITKEKEVKIFIDRSKVQKEALQNDKKYVSQGKKQLFEKEIFVQECLSKLEAQRQVLELKEISLSKKELSLKEMKMQIVQRDQDAQRQLIKISETKVIQDQLHDFLETQKRNLDSRETNIKRREQELALKITSIQNHDLVLTNLEVKLSERVNQMQGFDEKVFRKLLQNKKNQTKTVQSDPFQ